MPGDPPEEVLAELEALEAIYSEECTVVSTWPPEVQIVLKPRTAEDETLQFVLATLVLQTTENYPEDLPEVMLSSTKGLGDTRQTQLLAELRSQMREMVPGGLFVATAEAAFDLLTSINVPEGDCCFCMCPFSDDDDVSGHGGVQQLVKFGNCFHCFHKRCCLGWFRWQLRQHEAFLADVRRPKRVEGDPNRSADDFSLQCPVCRTPVDEEDLDRLRTLTDDESEDAHPAEALKEARFDTVEDHERQAAFQRILEAQRERGGIIEERATTPESLSGVVALHSSALWKAEEESQLPDLKTEDPLESATQSGRDQTFDSRPNDGASSRDRKGDTRSRVASADYERGPHYAGRGNQPARGYERGRLQSRGRGRSREQEASPGRAPGTSWQCSEGQEGGRGTSTGANERGRNQRGARARGRGTQAGAVWQERSVRGSTRGNFIRGATSPQNPAQADPESAQSGACRNGKPPVLDVRRNSDLRNGHRGKGARSGFENERRNKEASAGLLGPPPNVGAGNMRSSARGSVP